MGKKVTAPSPQVATEYVKKQMFLVGGWREAACGLWHKTLPQIIGMDSSLSISKIIVLLLRLLFVCSAAVLPIFARKVSQGGAGSNAGKANGIDWLGLFQQLDSLDYGLGALAIGIVAGPKLLDALTKGKRLNGDAILPTHELASALRRVPTPSAAAAVEDALRHALLGLRNELSELIGDERGRRLTDVTLLEFCDNSGAKMQVRARTADEVVKKPKASTEFLAYYVGMAGRWYAEHDFLNERNPFPKTRLTVPGTQPISYRSVLYIPITVTKYSIKAPSNAIQSQVTEQDAVDYCIGVICVHSSKPYRFWRWGDHKKGVDGFGNVAVSRAAPYIALVSKLIEPTSPCVPLKSD